MERPDIPYKRKCKGVTFFTPESEPNCTYKRARYIHIFRPESVAPEIIISRAQFSKDMYERIIRYLA